MKRDYIEDFLKITTLACFILLIINVSFQIITRVCFPMFARVWTEEMSRLLFVYSIAFAAPLSMKHNEYVNVDFILEFLPKKIRSIVELFILFMTIVFFSIILKESLSFTKLGISQISVTLEYKMMYAYMSMPIMLTFMLLYACINFYKKIKFIRS